MPFDRLSAPSSRRDFLRGVFGRAVAQVPEGVATAASVLARDVTTPDTTSPGDARTEPSLERRPRSLAVPADQDDLAESLVRRGRLRQVAPGRYVERFAIGAPGAATAEWLRRIRGGAPPDPTRPRDVMLVQAARAELATR